METVTIATITRGDPRMEYMSSMFDAFVAGQFRHIILQPGDHYLDAARNICVEKFFDDEDLAKDDWLMFIDDDQTFTREDVQTLLAKATPEHRVVCGWYLSTLPSGTGPVVYTWGPHDLYGCDHFNAVTVNDLREAERDDQGYITVEAAGTGFMAIRRSLLVEMRERWKAPTPFAEWVINGIHCGEDLTFCARVRRMGYDVHVQPDVHVGHIKTLELKERA